MPRSDWDDEYDYYEPSRPRQAKGGIKAQSKRGTFGTTWWGRRWMETLESFGLESRLARGRSYARSGQVLTLETDSGEVTAKVQGSERKPYAVRIRLEPLTDEDWQRLTDALNAEPILTARLMSGELPAEIEPILTAAKITLFPRRQRDLVTACSCPDPSNPCKHLAAVYCLLAEEFDRDPFLLFRLRGRDRDTLLNSLTGNVDTAEETPSYPPEPLPDDPATFWEGDTTASFSVGEFRNPPVNAPIIRRLGPFPLWRSETPIADALSEACSAAAQRVRRNTEGAP
jgi:uncharacterized Zn finger protein